jgi:hypothetical protein
MQSQDITILLLGDYPQEIVYQNLCMKLLTAILLFTALNCGILHISLTGINHYCKKTV